MRGYDWCTTYTINPPSIYSNIPPLLRLEGEVPLQTIQEAREARSVTFLCPDNPRIISHFISPTRGNFEIEVAQIVRNEIVCCTEGFGCEERYERGPQYNILVKDWVLMENGELFVKVDLETVRDVIETFIKDDVLESRNGLFISARGKRGFMSFGEKRGSIKIYSAFGETNLFTTPEIVVYSDRSIEVGERKLFTREEEFDRTWRLRMPILRRGLTRDLAGWAFIELRWLGDSLNVSVSVKRLGEDEPLATFDETLMLKNGMLSIQYDPSRHVIGLCPSVKLDRSVRYVFPAEINEPFLTSGESSLASRGQRT